MLELVILIVIIYFLAIFTFNYKPVNKKRHLFLLVLPIVLILIATLLALHKFTRKEINSKLEFISHSSANVLKIMTKSSGDYHLKKGKNELIKWLERFHANRYVMYTKLFKNKELIYSNSRFEQDFPVNNDNKDIRIYHSEIARILEIKNKFQIKNGENYFLHIGFDFDAISVFKSPFHRNFYIIVSLFTAIIVIMVGLIIYFDKKIFRQELELFKEKQDKERFKELSLLTSEIAHEIKNPLNSIYLSFNTLKKFIKSDKDAIFYRDVILGEIKRISNILNSYSDLSKDITPEIKSINLNHFKEEMNFLLSEEMENNNVSLIINIENEGSFKTDQNLLKQILLNLIKNSVEADANIIEINISLKEKKLIIIIKDDGKGIDEKNRDTIFKPYFSIKTKGMGLGLHISLKLVKSLNGKIELISKSAGNTIFKITLPKVE